MELEKLSNLKAPLPAALGSSGNPLGQKLSQLLSASFIDSEISSALEILEKSGFANDAGSRRELAPSVNRQVLETNKSVLEDYKHFVDEMHTIKMGIESMQAACNQMRAQALAVKASSSQLIEQSAFLREQKKKVEVKQRILSSFHAQFSVSENNIMILSSNDAIEEKFFECLTKVKQIREKCSVLLVADTQTAGLEIMETMSKHMDTGYLKLHRWILKELKSTTAGATEANVLLRQALTTLAERPDLYEKTLEHVSDARRRVVAADFEQARTRGRDGIRAMEANNHDSIRFVGDVLAWLHQSIASEREILEMVLGAAGRDRRSVLHKQDEEGSFNYRAMQNELIDRNFSLVMKPLQQRIDQVIVTQNDRLVGFKAAILVRFYRDTLSKVLEKEASVLSSLRSMERSATARFLQTTRNMIAQVNTNPPEPDTTLVPPVFLEDTIDDLTAVLEILNESFLTNEDRELEFTEIWDSLLRQCLEICIRMAADLPQPDSSIYLLNCASLLAETLKSVDFTTRQIAFCHTAIERSKAALVIEQHDFLLRSAGMITQIEALEDASTTSQAITSDTDINVDKNTIDETGNLKETADTTTHASPSPPPPPPQSSSVPAQTALPPTSISGLSVFSHDSLTLLTSTMTAFLPHALTTLTSRLHALHHHRPSRAGSQINNAALERFVSDVARLEAVVLRDVTFGRSVLGVSAPEVKRMVGLA